MDIQQLSKILDLCTRKGVKIIKIEGVEIELKDALPPRKSRRKKSDAEQKDFIPGGDITSEQLLFWSTPNYDGVTNA